MNDGGNNNENILIFEIQSMRYLVAKVKIVNNYNSMSADKFILRFKLMGRSVEGIVRKYRSYFTPRGYRLCREAGTKSIDDDWPGGISVIDISNTDILVDGGRYFFGLVSGLLEEGHCVYVVKKVWVVSELLKKPHSRILVSGRKISFIKKAEVTSRSGRGYYFWTDHDDNWEGAVNIRVSRSDRQDTQGGLWIPYQAHPVNCPLASECQVEEASMPRGIKVLFSGRVSTAYDSFFVRSHGVMNRVMILESLYAADLPIIVYDELTGEEPDFNSHVLLPRYDAETKCSSGSVPEKNYLASFKNVSFFICAPGTYMPFAHNVIEAMSQGCIPIIEYGCYFSPPLKDGENCLAFSDPETLIRAVNTALTMSDDEIVNMRRSVIKYYHDYLRFSSFMKRVGTAGNRINAHFTG